MLDFMVMQSLLFLHLQAHDELTQTLHLPIFGSYHLPPTSAVNKETTVILCFIVRLRGWKTESLWVMDYLLSLGRLSQGCLV